MFFVNTERRYVEAFITKQNRNFSHSHTFSNKTRLVGNDEVVVEYSVVHTRIRKKFRFQNQYPNERRREHTRIIPNSSLLYSVSN